MMRILVVLSCDIGIEKCIADSLFGFDGEFVKAARMIRGEVSDGPSRLQVCAFRHSSLMVRGH